MSSRLMPPKPGAIAFTIPMISSVSVVSRQMGQASIPANSLNSMALPSITGIAARGPMSPRPSTAVPSVTTATAFCLIVRARTLSGSAAIARQTRATPGVYAIERSSRVFTGTLFCTSILPPRCMRNVRSETFTMVTPGTSRTASTIRWPWSESAAETVTSRTRLSRVTRTRSIAPRSPSASPIAAATFANDPATDGSSTRIVRL